MPHPDEGTIHAWLDGALSPAEARAFETHVAGCAECEAAVAGARGLLAASSRILSALDNVPAGVVPGSDATFAERLARSSRDAGASGRFRATRWRAAAAIVVVAGASWLVLHPRPARDVPASERQTLAAASETAVMKPQSHLDSAAPQSTNQRAPSVLSEAQSATPTAKRAMVPRPTETTASRGDSPAKASLGYGVGAQGGVAQAPAATADALESRSTPAPRAAANAALSARDAVAKIAPPADMERRAQTLAKADVAARREVAQEESKDRATIDSVLAADSARTVPGYATLGAQSAGGAAKMRGATSAPSAVAPAPSRLLGTSSTVDRAAGCYMIETTGWAPEGEADHDSPSLLPSRIELQRAIGLSGDERGNRLARPATGEPGLPPGVIGFWTPLGSDKIRVTFADDTGWVALTLAVGAESVHGPGRAYSASSGRLRSTEVTARRTACR
jgi:hypothetical protein